MLCAGAAAKSATATATAEGEDATAGQVRQGWWSQDKNCCASLPEAFM